MPSCASQTIAGSPTSQTTNCYEILDLYQPKSNEAAVGQAEIKQAYRRALLFNHPDKSQSTDLAHSKRTQHTIDEVSKAYHTLIDPERRLEHDRHLKLEPRARNGDNHAHSHPGIETLDLDELAREDSSGEWYCDCRCGDTKGFTLMEDELQANSLSGEVITECRGCSLRLRVTFARAEDGA